MKQFSPLEKIQQAKLYIVQNLCFYGSIYWRLKVHEDKTCETAWTDGVSMGYNVEWLGQHTIMQITGVFIHEILHVILKHHLREQLNPVYQEHHLKFNMACDYALNPTVLAQPKLELPHGVLLDMTRFPDNLAEQIFTELTDDEVDQCRDGDPGSGNGAGSGAAGDPMIGEVRPFKEGKGSAAEKDQEAQKIDQWIKSASMKATNAGSMTDGLREQIKGLTTPTVHWEDELQFITESVCKNNYTWQRPNPRYMSTGCYLPTMNGYETPDMLYFVDTSGSLNSYQILQIKSEIRHILDQFSIRVIVVYWDTEFQGMEVFEPEDIFDPGWDLNIKGRGGTDFTDVLDWLEENQYEFDFDPKAVIFFTDLECSNYPDGQPDLPWLWVQLPGSGGSFNNHYTHYMPDWGTHVKCHVYKN